MPVHLIFRKSDGSVLKGLDECVVQSPDSKLMVDSDLNHGVVRPGETTVPQVVTVETFSWINDGDPNNPITDAGLFMDSYYTVDPTFSADTGKSFCGGASTATFGDYADAGGSHSASFDLSTILGWGDDGNGGLQISLDLGRTYTTVKTGTGDSFSTAIELAATSMDIGAVDGQLEAGDKATVYSRIQVPSTFTSIANAGVYLFNMGLFYNFTE